MLLVVAVALISLLCLRGYAEVVLAAGVVAVAVWAGFGDQLPSVAAATAPVIDLLADLRSVPQRLTSLF